MMRRPPADSFLLTVDDGPNGRTTPMLLDSFRDADARAVFFMVGIYIDEGAHPIMQRMVNEGHVLGGHSMDHADLKDLTEEELERNLDSMEEKFRDAVGDRPWIFRAPYGDLDDKSFQVLCRRDYVVMGWDVDTNDWAWKPKSDDDTYSGELASFANHTKGGILLLHDMAWTAAAFPALATAVESQSSRIKRLANPLEFLSAGQRQDLIEASCTSKGACMHATTRPWCDCVGARHAPTPAFTPYNERGLGLSTTSHAARKAVRHTARAGEGLSQNYRLLLIPAVFYVGAAIFWYRRLRGRRRAQRTS